MGVRSERAAIGLLFRTLHGASLPADGVGDLMLLRAGAGIGGDGGLLLHLGALEGYIIINC